MEKLVVLRDLQATRPSGPFRKGAGHGFAPDAFAQIAGFEGPPLPPEPRIEVHDATAHGRAELLADPEVQGITSAMPVRLIGPREHEKQEPRPTSAWGLEAIGATECDLDGSDVRVAVLDTGIDRGHPAFAGVGITPRNFTDDGDDDRNGHGTHCAGTIFGRDVEGTRIGVARGVSEALIAKVLDDQGRGSSEMLFEGLRWAASMGANVISMSVGFDFPGMVAQLIAEDLPADLATSRALEAYRGNIRMFDALMAMIRAMDAFGTGCVVVAAAGNESRRELSPDYTIAASLPAAAQDVVSVGAVERLADGYRIGDFSNTFPRVAAPGVAILSARAGGGLRDLTGTSMACPHVAGTAALWWQAVREQGLPLRAETVVAKVLAEARADVFVAGTSVADRGTGLVTAPRRR